MKNLIVLDSKWTYNTWTPNGHIIRYALVQFFIAMKKNIDLKLQKNIYIIKHILLYIHYVDLLIWSLTQLDFSLYFSLYDAFYLYDFSKMY
jgi:hypothetical protein